MNSFSVFWGCHGTFVNKTARMEAAIESQTLFNFFLDVLSVEINILSAQKIFIVESVGFWKNLHSFHSTKQKITIIYIIQNIAKVFSFF